MITIISTDEIEQGSEEWGNLRNQFITGTDAYSLLRGKSIQDILYTKQHAEPWAGNYWTQRGHDLEPDAKAVYSAIYQPTTDVGFVINDKFPYIGVSPDGLVGDDGLVEVKCFGEKRHFQTHKKPEPSIIAQIQYQLFVTERDWCDLVNYNPDIEDPHQAFLVKRIIPDPEIQQQFKEIFSKEIL